MTPTRGAILMALGLALAGCDSDNVQWAFVSNPGGSFGETGGAVIVIRWSNTSALGLGGDLLRVDGFDGQGPVSVLLPHRGDFAVLSRAGAVEVRSPALSFADGGVTRPGRVVAAGAVIDLPQAGGPAALRLQLADTAVVHPGGVGPGTLHIAGAGTLMILESAAGLVVLGEHAEPEVLGLSARLTTNVAGDRYALLLPDGRVRALIAPPLPLPAERLVSDPARGSVRLLGPRGEVVAELPRTAVQLQNGQNGLFLNASLPEGLPGDPVAMTLMMALDNRYLLRING